VTKAGSPFIPSGSLGHTGAPQAAFASASHSGHLPRSVSGVYVCVYVHTHTCECVSGLFFSCFHKFAGKLKAGSPRPAIVRWLWW
jgi:hypothetical protein